MRYQTEEMKWALEHVTTVVAFDPCVSIQRRHAMILWAVQRINENRPDDQKIRKPKRSE